MRGRGWWWREGFIGKQCKNVGKFSWSSLQYSYNNFKAFLVIFTLKLFKDKKTPYLENDITLKFQRKHLITRFELGNNNFRNQHIQVIKNSYVATNQTKMPVSITFRFLCTRLVCSLYNPFPNLHLVSSTQR